MMFFLKSKRTINQVNGEKLLIFRSSQVGFESVYGGLETPDGVTHRMSVMIHFNLFIGEILIP